MEAKWYCHTANADCEVEFREAVAIIVPSLIKVLEDRAAKDIRWETVELIGNLTNHGEWRSDNTAGQLTRMAKVEFREAIAGIIPSPIELLDNEENAIRWKIIELIGKLANHGKWKINVIVIANADCEVEFRDAVSTIIPSLNKLLEDQDESVRWETVELIGNLANHGE